MKVNLHGQVVLLTGATGGIGTSIVQHLSGAGATIAIQYHKHGEIPRSIWPMQPQRADWCRSPERSQGHTAGRT